MTQIPEAQNKPSESIISESKKLKIKKLQQLKAMYKQSNEVETVNTQEITFKNIDPVINTQNIVEYQQLETNDNIKTSVNRESTSIYAVQEYTNIVDSCFSKVEEKVEKAAEEIKIQEIQHDSDKVMTEQLVHAHDEDFVQAQQLTIPDGAALLKIHPEQDQNEASCNNENSKNCDDPNRKKKSSESDSMDQNPQDLMEVAAQQKNSSEAFEADIMTLKAKQPVHLQQYENLTVLRQSSQLLPSVFVKGSKRLASHRAPINPIMNPMRIEFEDQLNQIDENEATNSETNLKLAKPEPQNQAREDSLQNDKMRLFESDPNTEEEKSQIINKNVFNFRSLESNIIEQAMKEQAMKNENQFQQMSRNDINTAPIKLVQQNRESAVEKQDNITELKLIPHDLRLDILDHQPVDQQPTQLLPQQPHQHSQTSSEQHSNISQYVPIPQKETKSKIVFIAFCISLILLIVGIKIVQNTNSVHLQIALCKFGYKSTLLHQINHFIRPKSEQQCNIDPKYGKNIVQQWMNQIFSQYFKSCTLQKSISFTKLQQQQYDVTTIIRYGRPAKLQCAEEFIDDSINEEVLLPQLRMLIGKGIERQASCKHGLALVIPAVEGGYRCKLTNVYLKIKIHLHRRLESFMGREIM